MEFLVSLWAVPLEMRYLRRVSDAHVYGSYGAFCVLSIQGDSRPLSALAHLEAVSFDSFAYFAIFKAS